MTNTQNSIIILLYRIYITQPRRGGKEHTVVVTRETLIGDILDFDTGTAKFFFEMGMHCLGCPHSRGESIEEACAVHGTDVEELIKSINDYLASKA